jgi:hypothetical protein
LRIRSSMMMIVLVLILLVVTALPAHATSTGSPIVSSHSALFGEQVSVSADGHRILVGAPDASVVTRNGTSVFSAGEAYLYNSQGKLLHAFSDTSPTIFEQYASSVSISADGDLVLVGAPYAGASGIAFLYNSGGHLIREYLPPTAAGANSRFGSSVAFLARNNSSGANTTGQSGVFGADSQPAVLIGAISAPGTSPQGGTVGGAGQVYMYDALGNLLRIYGDSDPTVDENFGLSVSSMTDGSVAVGAPNAVTVTSTGAVVDSAGKVLLFDPAGNLAQVYRDPNPSFFEQFGWSVSLSTINLGPNFDVFIGAPGASSVGPPGYTVYGGAVFLYSSNGALFGKIPNRSTECFEFGNSISISADGTSMVTGAPLCTSGNGTVFLFTVTSNFVPAIQDPSPVPGEKFGFSVSMSADGSVMAIGALFRGNAFIFNNSGVLLQVL